MIGYPNNAKAKFKKAGSYQIVVQGSIPKSRSDLLAGMSIAYNPMENGTPRTLLRGHLRDQAQLSGVLNILYEWHMPILLVEYINEDYGFKE
jgi:hypothetical protein